MDKLIMQTNIIRDGAVVATQGEDISQRLDELAELGYDADAIAKYERAGVIKRESAEEQ